MDMYITTAAARVTGAEATDYRTEATAGTGVHVGVKGTLPIMTIYKTDRGSSSETRRIMTEVVLSDSREEGS